MKSNQSQKNISAGLPNYDKLQKSTNEPAKEYNQIKDLVEIENNSLTNICFNFQKYKQLKHIKCFHKNIQWRILSAKRWKQSYNKYMQ